MMLTQLPIRFGEVSLGQLRPGHQVILAEPSDNRRLKAGEPVRVVGFRDREETVGKLTSATVVIESPDGMAHDEIFIGVRREKKSGPGLVSAFNTDRAWEDARAQARAAKRQKTRPVPRGHSGETVLPTSIAAAPRFSAYA